MKKLTRDDLTAQVDSTDYFYHGTLTICVITFKNGFKSVGHSACLNPADYIKKRGEDIAFERALEKLWELLGFHTMEKAVNH